MAITLEETKQYLRISYTNDDKYIEDLISMSKKLIQEQTGVEYSDADSVYKMAILQAVAHYYDKRESFTEKAISSVPYTLDSLIKHIGMRGSLNE